MSVFKTEGIVLKTKKTQEQSAIYTVFFAEYGILRVTRATKVREKPIDIGYVINCEIITKQDRDIHRIGTIKILAQFRSQSYSDIHHFLLLLSLVYREIPIGNPHYEIFSLLKNFIMRDTHSTQDQILTYLKLQSLIGKLGDNSTDSTVQKILKFIHASSYSDILRLEKIPQDILKSLSLYTHII